MAASSPQGLLSYADRARMAQTTRSSIEAPVRMGQPSASVKFPTSDQKPQKPAAVNVWDRRKEELAARSQPRENVSLEPSGDDDDDPFVVRSSRAGPHVPVAAESPEDWPEVGKSVQPPTADEPRPANGDNSLRKGGAPKWIPLQLQSPVEAQSQFRKDVKSNRQSANTSRPPSNNGHGRNSRNHSGRNSANHSRIHSNEGSTHSSPRNPRNKRLPADEPSSASNSNSNTNRSSRTGSPSSHIQVPSDIPTYGTYLSPQQGPSPYYSQQPPVSSTVYHSPSNAPYLSLPPTDTSLPPMPPPPVHGYPYPYPNPYVPYDYIPPSAPYPYWNGHQGSHPGSGTHSPAYPSSATPSSYTAALPIHVQQHFPQPMQSQPSSHSHSSSRSSKMAPESGSPGTTAVAVPSQSSTEQSKANGSTSVVFGSIESPSLPPETTISPSASSIVDDNGIEKVFKTLAIGVDSSTIPKSRRSANKLGKDKEVVVDGEIAVDPAIVKEAEAGSTGDRKWKFGNEGLVSGGDVVEPELPDTSTNVGSSDSGYIRSAPVMDDGLEEDFRVKNFGYGFGTAAGGTVSVDVPKDDVDAPPQSLPPTAPENDEPVHMTTTPPTTTMSEYPSQPGSSNSRPRRGGYNNNGSGGYGNFDRGGYAGERRRGRGGGMNGYGGRGGYHSRGYGGRGSGNLNHNHNQNSNNYNHSNGHNQNNMYQSRHQIPPPAPFQTAPASFSVTPPPLFQGLPPPPSHMDSPYYPLPPSSHRGGHGGMATYIPTGYEPYPPPPPPAPLLLHTPSSSVQTPSSLSRSQSQSSTGHGGHGHAAPPMPMPMSQLGFPLDSTRYYLLGQLEYYLSPQNMAQDLFLRRRMDSRGWIEISLLASFNRVKQLTMDYQLVREVLMLSTLVQVREGYVRMGGWERFVLPDAMRSVVEGGDGNATEDPQQQRQQQGYLTSSYDLQSPPLGELGNGNEVSDSGGVIPPSQQQQHWNYQYSNGGVGGAGEEEADYAEEEEEEDDVVFVMGQNGGEGMWSHEKRAVG